MFSEQFRLARSKRLHPLLAVSLGLPFFVVGVLLIGWRSSMIWALVGGFALLLVLFGAGKNLVRLSLISIPLLLLAFGLTAVGSGVSRGLENALRFYVLIMGAALTLTVDPIDLVRALNQIRCPRSLSVGMLITLRFFTVFGCEFRRIRRAILTRGCGCIYRHPALMFRAWVMPLLFRVFTISTHLSTSLETRAFDPDAPCTNYREIHWGVRDTLFSILMMVLLVGVLYAR